MYTLELDERCLYFSFRIHALTLLCNLTVKRGQVMTLISENEAIQFPISHAAVSIDRSVRIQSSSGLESLPSVSTVFSYLFSFLSLSMVNVILISFLIVDT